MARYNNMMDRAVKIQAMKDAREGRNQPVQDDEDVKMKNSMYAQNARDNSFGGTRDGQDMVLSPSHTRQDFMSVQNSDGSMMSMDAGSEEVGSQWVPVGGDSWSGAELQRRQQEASDREKAFDQAQDGIAQIEMLNKQKIELDNQNRNQWLVGLVSSAFRNGGMSDRSLSEGASQALGQQIYGVQRLSGLSGEERNLNGSYAVYGAKDDGQGGQTVGVVGVVTPETVLKVLDKLGAGANHNRLRQQLWNDGGFDRYTPQQQAQMGVRNPNAVTVSGTTNIEGSLAKRLFGEKPHSRVVGSFSSDGMGGFSESRYDGSTGESWSRDYGTRDPNHQGKWKVRMSGHDGTVYDNDKTGESITVPKGSSLRDVMAESEAKKNRGRGRHGSSVDDILAVEAAREARQKARDEARAELEKDKQNAAMKKQYKEDFIRIRKQIEDREARKSVADGEKMTPEQIEEEAWNTVDRLYDRESPDGGKKPVAEKGKTASPEGDNNGGAGASVTADFKELSREEFGKLPKEKKIEYLKQLKERKARKTE